MAGAVLVAALVWSPWLLFAIPVVGYGGAWLGHFAFEKNQPASWFSARHAAWSLRGDFRMWGLMLTRKMANELEASVQPESGRTRSLDASEGEA